MTEVTHFIIYKCIKFFISKHYFHVADFHFQCFSYKEPFVVLISPLPSRLTMFCQCAGGILLSTSDAAVKKSIQTAGPRTDDRLAGLPQSTDVLTPHNGAGELRCSLLVSLNAPVTK